MGNKIMSTRAFVDEKYTRPQGLYDPKDADYRKLRRLILSGQLAPCFPGVEDCTSELDECPICFLFYPSLNRSRCCSKAICTECYLQVKSMHFARCPFCKTSSYTVEFRGAKTAAEKGVEQAEEQKVIEAKIRIRQKELRDEAERTKRLVEDTQAEPFEHDGNIMLMEPGMSTQAAHVQGSLPGSDRSEGFDLDMEDMMIMEAISLSIQEQGPTHQEIDLAQQIPTISSTRFAGRTCGLRRAIAAFAERQTTSAEIRGEERVVNNTRNFLDSNKSLTANHNDMPSPECRDLATRSCTNDPLCRGSDANGGLQKEKQDFLWEKRQNGEQSWRNASCGSEELNGWLDDSNGNSFWSSVKRESGDFTFDLELDQSSLEAVEASTSFSSTIPSASDLPWEAPDFHSSQSSDYITGETSLSSASGSLLPVSFEDQIMLAITLSLADAQAQGRRR